MMAILAGHRVRESVSALSSGTYYPQVSHWWEKVCEVLRANGFVPQFEDCPLIYNNEGHSLVKVLDKDGEETGSSLLYSWYRMQSSNWEIVSYLT